MTKRVEELFKQLVSESLVQYIILQTLTANKQTRWNLRGLLHHFQKLQKTKLIS